MCYMLIDGNNLGYIAQDARKLYLGDQEIQAVYGFVRILRNLLRDNPGFAPIVLWDGHAKWRYDLFPLYKSGRDDDPARAAERESYRKQRPMIMRALETLGVRQFTDPNAEADDLAGYFSRRLKNVRLVSGDTDWCQLVSANTSWYCPRTKRECSITNFEKFTKFKTPQLFLESKCLIGDDSDTIPGVGGIGKDTVGAFLEKYGSVEGFFRAVDDPSTRPQKLPKAHAYFADNKAPDKESSRYGKLAPMRDAYYRNMKLMCLDGYEPNKNTLNNNPGHFDRKAFELLCREYSFRSILLQIDDWIKPFERQGK